MADKIEYAAHLPGMEKERRESFFAHIKELQKKNLEKKLKKLEDEKKREKKDDPMRAAKIARIRKLLEGASKSEKK